MENTQQNRALINELKELNRNLSKMTTILNRMEISLREVAIGHSKDESTTVEEETEE